MNKILITGPAILFLLFCGCSKTNSYKSALSELLDKDAKIQVLAQYDSGGIIYIEDEKKSQAYKKLDAVFKELVGSKEIVLLFEHKVSDFKKSAEILRNLKEASIPIYVKAEHAYIGISEGGKVYVAKGDKVKAKEILNAK